MYMMFLGVDLNLIAVLMLGVRAFDAVDDLCFGVLCDKVTFNRRTWLGRGRFMPWIKISVVLLPVCTFLLYHIPPGWNHAMQVAWLALAYIAWDLSFTLSDVPNTALAITMTDNYEERNSIMNLRYAIPLVAAIPVSYLFTLLISAEVGMSISAAMTVLIIIYTLFMIPEVFVVKERNVAEEVPDEDGHGYTFKEMLHFLATCKEAWAPLLMKFFTNAGTSSLGTFVYYYCWGSVLYIALFGVPGILAFVVYFVAIIPLLKRFEKGGVARVSLALYTGANVVSYVLGYREAMLIPQLICGFIVALCAVPSAFMTPMMLTDVVEMVRYRYGMDASGVIFSLNTFMEKLGQAVAASLPLVVLGLFGWQSVEAESFADLAAAGVVQSEFAITGLWFVHALMPAIAGLLSFIASTFYKLKKPQVEVMTQCNEDKITREEAEKRLALLD